jgi:hypothetical protein
MRAREDLVADAVFAQTTGAYAPVLRRLFACILHHPPKPGFS